MKINKLANMLNFKTLTNIRNGKKVTKLLKERAQLIIEA